MTGGARARDGVASREWLAKCRNPYALWRTRRSPANQLVRNASSLYDSLRSPCAVLPAIANRRWRASGANDVETGDRRVRAAAQLPFATEALAFVLVVSSSETLYFCPLSHLVFWVLVLWFAAVNGRPCRVIRPHLLRNPSPRVERIVHPPPRSLDSPRIICSSVSNLYIRRDSATTRRSRGRILDSLPIACRARRKVAPRAGAGVMKTCPAYSSNISQARARAHS